METLKALLTAHGAERHVFTRMIDMDMDVDTSRKIMAYWMYLESLGFKDFLKKLSLRDDKFISLVCAEAELALATLQPDSAIPISSTSPITFNLANPNFSLYDVVEDRERVSRGVSDLYDGVCSVVFEDILEERGLRSRNVEGEEEEVEGKGKGKEEEECVNSGNLSKLNPFAKEWVGKLVRVSGVGTSQQGAIVVPGGGTTAEGGDKPKMGGSGSKLNPNAKEWYPPVDGDEESRCLYITFSNGYPLSENQIYFFFTLRYGPYVEKIYIHQPRNSVPLFGKITFKASFVPALILNGKEQVKFYIDGRTIWCKKYNRRNREA